MKTLAIVIVILLIVSVAGLFLMAQKSQTPPVLGVQNMQLQPCKYTTHCVNSQSQDESHIGPLPGKYWPALPEAVQKLGGRIEQQRDDYLWVTFRSRWIGFVDDVEFVYQQEAGNIDLRSSSRVGRSDFGVNRQRVEMIRDALSQSSR